MKNLKIIIICLSPIILASCGGTKTIFKGNKLYTYVNNQGSNRNDQIVEYTVTKKFKSEIKDKTSYYEITAVDTSSIKKSDSVNIDPLKVKSYTAFEGKYYTPEKSKFMEDKEFEVNSLKYYYGKFALTAMTIPLKYRRGVGNDTINPPTFETNFNVNFAPSYRFNWSTYNSSKKLFGKELTNYSLTLGGLLGLGATDLKTNSNAPGLLSNRKSAVFSYGAMVLFGFNKMGIGYSFGFDSVLGEGSGFWVYQNKLWHGITISVDIIK